MIYIEAKDGWHRHPFTISSAPHEDVVRVTVKALGDYTSRLQELIEPGMPAVIGGPHGRFSHWKGTDRQVWIAGGVGVAPFLSWLRALDGHQLPHRVDFFYSADGEAPFADEIRAIADRHEVAARASDRHGRRRAPHARARPRRRRRRPRRAVGLHVRSAGHAAQLPDRAADGRRAGPAHPPRVLRLALTIGGARVRCRHVRRDAAPSGPALGRAPPGRPRPDAAARRRGVAGARGRAPTRRRPSGAWPCAGLRSSGSPPPTGWPWRWRAGPASGRSSRAGSCCARRARPRSTSPTPSTASARPRWRRGRRRWPRAAREEAERLHAEEDAASAAIAAHGADLLAGARRIATHCNTGALAAGGQGTALAVILALHERGAVHVLAGETRPLLQGARLTVWELARAGVAPRARGRRRDGRAHPPRRGRRGRSWAPTAWPPTATPPTRSAPIRWPWPPRAAGIPFVVAAPDVDHRRRAARRRRHRDRGARRRRGPRVRRRRRRRCPAPPCATRPSTSPRPRW